MTNESQFVCEACDKVATHDSTKGHIPFGWCNRNIEGTVYLLCEACGIEGPHAADIAPSLCEKFARKGIYFQGCKQWVIEPN